MRTTSVYILKWTEEIGGTEYTSQIAYEREADTITKMVKEAVRLEQLGATDVSIDGPITLRASK